VEPALEEILNLLLESERAGVVALEKLAGRVAASDLKRLLTTSREDEANTVRELDELIRSAGGTASQRIGPFADKVENAGALSQQLKLLIHGDEWVARKIEEALALASATGAVHDYLARMARRHRFEVEWGRAELIRHMNTLK
jgi:ubiquinone biosynthesis protein UbiJ